MPALALGGRRAGGGGTQLLGGGTERRRGRVAAEDASFYPWSSIAASHRFAVIAMTTVLLTDSDNPRCVTPERGDVRARLLTRLRSRQLDRALAAGTPPDSSAALSLRAYTLIGPGFRGRLARSVHTLIEDAQRRRPLDPGVPICRRKVLRSVRTLEQLADRLAAGGPVDVRGIARLELLLNDADGPVYERPAADDLEPALREALRALELSA